MSLHAGLDTCGIISHGVFTKTYGVGEEANVANVYASFGYYEDAAEAADGGGGWHFFNWFWEFF